MIKPVFNSLGSNYSGEFVKKSLKAVFVAAPRDKTQLKQVLNDRFNGKSWLFYKGRDAIEFAVRSILAGQAHENKLIFTQALACYAVEEGIKRAGAQAIYVDIEKDGINMDVRGLRAARAQHGQPAAVLVQHTLGVPANIQAIKNWCAREGAILIEDLAQSFGGSDSNGVPLGTSADIVVTSFGRDKVIDSVSGGACIIKNTQVALQSSAPSAPNPEPPFSAYIYDYIYPPMTWLIRTTFNFLYVGRLVLYLAKKLHLMKTPLYSPTNGIAMLPASLARLALWQSQNLDEQLQHRRQIAGAYWQELSSISQLKLPTYEDAIGNGSNLRFPVIFSSEDQLTKTMALLAQNQIYVSDRWYRSAVDCSSIKCDTDYIAGSCPNAEAAAKTIINLPTHRGVSVSQAQIIAQLIKEATAQS